MDTPIADMQISVSWEDMDGNKSASSSTISLSIEDQKFDNLSIRKAILLVHYIDMLKQHCSKPLSKQELETFKNHFSQEIDIIGDSELEKEGKILHSLCEQIYI